MKNVRSKTIRTLKTKKEGISERMSLKQLQNIRDLYNGINGFKEGYQPRRFLPGAGNFSVHHRVQNGSGAHPASYSMGSRGSFPGGKAAEE
jgi:hypothetical protein